jgi:predicted amidohydrolase YtcJ
MASYTPGNFDYYKKAGKYKSDRLQVRSFKLYADGALGSRGACLIHDYSDLPGHKGFLLTTIDSLKDAARRVSEIGFQLNTHCIGDSANHVLLQIYSDVLEIKNDKRWRIEHAQVLAPDDFKIFGDYSIIPSVQPTHATSDMYWAGDRLGSDRIKYAYAYKQLLEQNGMIAGGSDFPVEDINPLYGFYAAVARKDKQQYPEGGFNPENAITREQALRAMTIWAAYAAFEEGEKGSLEKGKMADFVVLDRDIMTEPDSVLFGISTRMTVVGGEVVFKSQ